MPTLLPHLAPEGPRAFFLCPPQAEVLEAASAAEVRRPDGCLLLLPILVPIPTLLYLQSYHILPTNITIRYQYQHSYTNIAIADDQDTDNDSTNITTMILVRTQIRIHTKDNTSKQQ